MTQQLSRPIYSWPDRVSSGYDKSPCSVLYSIDVVEKAIAPTNVCMSLPVQQERLRSGTRRRPLGRFTHPSSLRSMTCSSCCSELRSCCFPFDGMVFCFGSVCT